MRNLITLIFGLGFAAAATAAPVPFTAGGELKYYELSTDRLSFWDAYDAARSAVYTDAEGREYAGQLVVIDTAAELGFLSGDTTDDNGDIFNNRNRDAWIALTRANASQEWEWIDGAGATSPLVFSEWAAAPYEVPDGLTGRALRRAERRLANRSYAVGWAGRNGRGEDPDGWRDIRESANKRYVIEYTLVPMPVAASLPMLATGLGLVGVIAMRRRKKQR